MNGARDDRDAVFAPALAIANAVLYEGYLLFPYRKSSGKNRVRWQFGVVVPEAYLSAGTGETAEQQTEVLVEHAAGTAPRVTVLLRFLQVEARRVEALENGVFVPVESLRVGETAYLTFDEAVEREIELTLEAAPDAAHEAPISIGGGTDEETLRDASGVRGRVVRERWPLRGTLSVACEALPREEASGVETPGVETLVKLRVRVRNASDVVAGERAGALRTALVSTHVLLAVENGAFVSVLDPAPAAAEVTKTLKNRHLFPVLVGDEAGDEQRAAMVLASPIILYDFPKVAPQTDTDHFDGTEIDELLTLSVLSLPDAERDEARATDPRARAIVERAERFGAGEIARVHAGSLHRTFGDEPFGGDAFAADPFAELDVPALDCVFVDGTKVAKGSAVRLHPKRRADVWDMFLDGKAATVRKVHQDVENVLYVAVTVDDDPASDLHDWYGRSLFFYPDEIEPVESPP
ncbi:MAG TPA: hypothetical protein VHS78_20300 [Candidatus Elarobacter sp.]|jgi:hypothetical protein|nr:hypothetical protein [Candidatus Elarobacter sp.]